MTQKDYIKIAAVISELPADMRYTVKVKFAEMLAADNPRFDTLKFLAACKKS